MVSIGMIVTDVAESCSDEMSEDANLVAVSREDFLRDRGGSEGEMAAVKESVAAPLAILPVSPSLNGVDNTRIPKEIKFLVSGEMARRVREWARQAMQPDPYAVPHLDHAYQVRSLYLDTPELHVFHRRGSYARGKYRIRQYLPTGIVFLERKLKSKGVVRKRRTETRLEELLNLLRRPGAKWSGLWYEKRLVVRRLQPICQIAYVRHPFMEQNGSTTLRLTIDKDIRAKQIGEYSFHEAKDAAAILPEQAILELKYFGQTPALFKEMMDRFELTAQPVSKYRLAVSALGIAREETPAIASEASR